MLGGSALAGATTMFLPSAPNYTQVAVVYRIIGDCWTNADREDLEDLPSLTANGIAAGLRNTG